MNRIMNLCSRRENRIARTPDSESRHKIGFHPILRANRSAAEVNTRKMMYIGRISSSGPIDQQSGFGDGLFGAVMK